MRLKYYINEENKGDDFSKIMNDLFDNCYPFIKELVGNHFSEFDKFLYSGRSNKPKFYRAKIRTNRRPLDTHPIIHDMIDKVLYEKFGFHARSNALFCTGNAQKAYGYGIVYCIFPVGKYKYIWSPKIEDLYKYFSRKSEEILMKIEDEKEYYKMKEKLKNKIKKIANSYKDTDLRAGIKSGNEIMLWAKEYIALDSLFYDDKLNYYFSEFGTQKPTPDKIQEVLENT